MNPLLPAEMEKALTRDTSHLIIRSASPDLRGRLRGYLRQRGVVIKKEQMFDGLDGQPWLLVSLAQTYAGALVLELIEQGFPECITGIDAKPGAVPG